MGSEAISVRTEPVSGRKAGGQRRHDLRDPAQTPDYVDRSRSHLNSVLIEPPDPTELRAEIAQHRTAAGQQKLRADAQTVVRGVITFGTDAQPKIEALTREEQDRLFERVATEIARESGHPLIGLVVHRDESAIHAHYMLRGYRLDEQGKERPWRKTRAEMSRLQDIAAAVPEVKALGIKRGTPKAERIAKGEDRSKVIHRTVRQLHQDLPKELEQARKATEHDKATLQAELEKITAELEAQQAKAEKNRRLIEEQERKLAEHRVSEEQAAKRIDAYERRMAKAREEIAALEASKAERVAEIEELDTRKAELEAEVQAIEAQEKIRFPDTPKAQTVEVIVSKGLLRDKTAKIDVVRAEDMHVFASDAATAYHGAMTHAVREDQKARAVEVAAGLSIGADKVLELVLESQWGQALRSKIPALDEWAKEREKRQQQRIVRPKRQQQRQRGRGIGD